MACPSAGRRTSGTASAPPSATRAAAPDRASVLSAGSNSADTPKCAAERRIAPRSCGLPTPSSHNASAGPSSHCASGSTGARCTSATTPSWWVVAASLLRSPSSTTRLATHHFSSGCRRGMRASSRYSLRSACGRALNAASTAFRPYSRSSSALRPPPPPPPPWPAAGGSVRGSGVARGGRADGRRLLQGSFTYTVSCLRWRQNSALRIPSASGSNTGSRPSFFCRS
ncbi:MAG: hypothetical protein GAK31_02055 [Stenotrophomonas maltophilia]|uniref:Uncharacterized protein n=1 Tax=Stenotrophomonas maltophilia TaxID=40324 RepID=A0A7V8JKY3_STEMA|nr:MAG: hypothetical protein GAK31_02055 [Stenotrophomonas maltophilia]